jgi:hypothetical protein
MVISDASQNLSSAGEVVNEGVNATCVDSDPSGVGTTPGVLFKREFVARIPLQPTLLTAPAARAFKVTWKHAAGLTPTSTVYSVLGYEVGP